MQRDEIEREAQRAQDIAEICQRHGELDGANAAESQRRALRAEIERLDSDASS